MNYNHLNITSMKKLNYLLGFILLSALVSYPYLKKEFNGDNVKISVNETVDVYKFSAEFNKSQSKKVQEYMDDFLNQHTFRNAEIDADITLDDRTKFYAKVIPGEVKIKLNKDKNTVESYHKIKEMGEGIKRVLAGK
jgi:hypothetical protein